LSVFVTTIDYLNQRTKIAFNSLNHESSFMIKKADRPLHPWTVEPAGNWRIVDGVPERTWMVQNFWNRFAS